MNGIKCVSDLEANEERSGALTILNYLQAKIHARLMELNQMDDEDPYTKEYEYQGNGLREVLEMIHNLKG